MNRLALVALVLAACGDDGGGMMQAADARPVDGTAAKVVEIGCPASPPTVTTTNTSSVFTPATTTIAVNGIVKFVNSSDHSIVPNPQTTSDPAFTVGFGATKCLQFKVAGTYGFMCNPHGFTGTIVVN